MNQSMKPLKYTLRTKVAVLKAHLLEGISASDLCDEPGLESHFVTSPRIAENFPGNRRVSPPLPGLVVAVRSR